MKEFTIKKRRDGESWKEVDSFYAKDWQDAKRLFTERMSDDDVYLFWCDDEVIVDILHDDDEANVSWYDGKGLYVQDCNGIYFYDSSRYLSSFTEDVWHWTINRV